MRTRLVWEILLLACGVIYVVMVFCDNVQCFFFAVAFVVLAAQVLMRAHRKKRPGGLTESDGVGTENRVVRVRRSRDVLN